MRRWRIRLKQLELRSRAIASPPLRVVEWLITTPEQAQVSDAALVRYRAGELSEREFEDILLGVGCEKLID